MAKKIASIISGGAENLAGTVLYASEAVLIPTQLVVVMLPYFSSDAFGVVGDIINEIVVIFNFG